jgi:hypothetical protein
MTDSFGLVHGPWLLLGSMVAVALILVFMHIVDDEVDDDDNY